MNSKIKSYEYNEQIQYILDNFDFSIVERVMRLVNLEWHLCDGKFSYIPDISQLIDRARQLLKKLVVEPLRSIESGGLVAEKNNGYLTLKFILTGVDTQ